MGSRSLTYLLWQKRSIIPLGPTYILKEFTSVYIFLHSPPRSKSPLFDELSIPFIDASLPPTPKTGRSQNALEILLGRRSLNSSDVSLTGILLLKGLIGMSDAKTSQVPQLP